MLLAGIATLVIALFFWSVVIEPGLLIQKNLNFEKWPGPKLKVAFLSDLHAGSPHITKNYIEDLVVRINSMSPDIILIGGDLAINGIVGGKPIPFAEVANILKKLNSRLGTFAVLGNHDWWNDSDEIIKDLEAAGIQVLENKAKLITNEMNRSFWVVGIGDQFTQHANPTQALSQINTEDPKIIFMHDPAALFGIKNKFEIALAGHLHGGQVFIPGIGALITPGDAPKEWAKGWIDFKIGSLYVSQGIGTSILPIRFNSPPEFVILNLNENSNRN